MNDRASESRTTAAHRASAAPAGRPAARLRREERTIAAMIELYCRDHHGAARRQRSSGAVGRAGSEPLLCPDCAALLEYARRRLVACRYGSDKPTCARCPVHCYRPAMREEVREVMRHSGPRMLRRHPLLAVAHLLDGRRLRRE